MEPTEPISTSMLTDHQGKTSSARAISWTSALTFCGLLVLSAFDVAELPSREMMMTLAAMAVAPQWLKGRYEKT